MFQCYFKRVIPFVRNHYTLSYAFGGSNESLSPQTISDIYEENAIECPERVAIISHHQGITKTYRQLNDDINKLASVLTSLGCNRGDRVGLWAPNCYEWIVTQIATAKIATIMVNINPAYRLNELKYCMQLVELNTLIASQRVKTSNYYEMLQTLIPQLKNGVSTKQMEISDYSSLRNIIMLNHAEEPAPSNFLRFNELMGSAPQNELYVRNEFDDAINIQFTSGTTGNPKGATLSHHNVVNNAKFVMKRMCSHMPNTYPVICLPVPLYHCFSCIVGSLMCAYAKGTVVLPSQISNPIASLEAIQNYKCDMYYGTPTMYVDILNSPLSNYNIKSLLRGAMSGSSCPPELLRSFMKAVPSVKHIGIPYGSTESSPVVTLTSITDSENHRFKSVGRPLDHTEIKIIDPKTGSTVPIGEKGEILIRGYCTFIGYWNQSDKTKEVLDNSRWYHTGDIGIMDSDGFISIEGRIKEMIIRGGENIYPREIENFLLTNPMIADAHVIGVKDKRMGEEMCAFIRLKNEEKGNVSENDIKTFCKDKISHFKIPRYIEFVDNFPCTVSGKVQKYILKELAEKKYPQS